MLGLQKLISLKKIINKLVAKFINTKNPPILKEESHIKYKNYIDLFFTLMKKTKQAYYNKYFERNWNNIKKTWKRIKSPIFLKNCSFQCIDCFLPKQW